MNQTEPKKILIAVESIDVDDSSGSKANVALIENLHKAGFELRVFHYSRRPIDLPGINCIPVKEVKWNMLYFLSRVQRRIQNDLKILIYKPLENTFGFSFTFFNDTNSFTKALKNIDFEPDLVITLSKAASFRPHFALLKLPHLHSRWMAYIHDPYPFHYYPNPYNWSEPGYKQKITFFQEVAEKCRWAAFPSLLLMDWVSKYFPAFKSKGVIIPHQLENFINDKQSFPSYFDSSKFTILHAGSLLKQRSPIFLIKAYRKFLENNSDAKLDSNLIFLGSHSYHQEELMQFENEISQLYLSEGYVPYEEVRLLQANVSVNVILESTGTISPFLPGKFPHCVAANKPILLLGPERSESKRLLGETYPYWSKTDDIAKITLLLEDLYYNWKKDPNNLSLSRKDLEEYLSIEQLRTTIEDLLK